MEGYIPGMMKSIFKISLDFRIIPHQIISVLQKSFQMIIPEKISIQITDKDGNPNPIPNVLFGCKIYLSENGWHNYSPFKKIGRAHV